MLGWLRIGICRVIGLEAPDEGLSWNKEWRQSELGDWEDFRHGGKVRGSPQTREKSPGEGCSRRRASEAVTPRRAAFAIPYSPHLKAPRLEPRLANVLAVFSFLIFFLLRPRDSCREWAKDCVSLSQLVSPSRLLSFSLLFRNSITLIDITFSLAFLSYFHIWHRV